MKGCYQTVRCGVSVYACTNNHFAGHGTETVRLFQELWEDMPGPKAAVRKGGTPGRLKAYPDLPIGAAVPLEDFNAPFNTEPVLVPFLAHFGHFWLTVANAGISLKIKVHGPPRHQSPLTRPAN